MRTNRSGTENVIRACEEAGVQRLVYVSSVAVHGAKAGLQLSSATPLLKTGRDYSDSKIVAEELIRTAHETSRLCAVIVRPTYVWGPRSAVFTVRQLREMRAGLFRYVDRGCSVANAVYVDNLVDALIGAGVEQEAAGRAFLVTDGSAYCWQELFDGYARMLSLGTFRSVSSRSWIDRGGGRLLDASETALLALRGPRSLPVRVARRAIKLGRDALRSQFVDSWELNKYSCDQQADISVTRRCLGYEPRIALAQGLELTERWVRDQLGFEFNLEVNT